MATGSTTSASSISTISGYCTFGDVQYGSNGATGGASEYRVGDASGPVASGRAEWDSNVSDGIDSGWVAVTFTAEAGGGANGTKWALSIGSPSQLTYGGRTYGAIQKVRLRAAVQLPAAMRWQSVSVQFFRNGRVTETFTQTTGPAVDTTGTTPGVAEQILEVTPGFSNNTKVVVSGQVRLEVPQGTTPAADDLFAQVYVNAASCTAV